MAHTCKHLGRHIVIPIAHREPRLQSEDLGLATVRNPACPSQELINVGKWPSQRVLLHEVHAGASPKRKPEKNQISLLNFSSTFFTRLRVVSETSKVVFVRHCF